MARRQTRGDFVETESGNRISRQATILGSQHILLAGRSTILPECVLRGDLYRRSSTSSAVINIGRYVFLEKAVVLKPPSKLHHGANTHYPLRIGNSVTIGANSVIEAAVIESYVEIGQDCVIGKFAIIKEGVRIHPNSVVPSTTCIPAYSEVSGNPAVIINELPESTWDIFDRKCRQLYALHGTSLTTTSIKEIMSLVFDDDDDDSVDI
ncbi:trimeric LpxA-like protein [Lipomyces arxii]|uniref:trimeric LpxA-like protein n=1 Tax=Lipomyces arxii TaxID=56418 RepID=UPI0034CD6FB2